LKFQANAKKTGNNLGGYVFVVLCISRRRFMYKNIVYFHISTFFLVFKHDFTRSVDSRRIAASDTASDSVTN